MARKKRKPAPERDEELDQEQVTDLPDREAMTIIQPTGWPSAIQPPIVPPHGIIDPPRIPPPGPIVTE